MTCAQLAEIASRLGFTAWSDLDISTIVLRPEVRDMCAANSCGQYGKCWSCPPGCGTLPECEARLASHTNGILVQTCGDIEDGFDFDAMMDIELSHKKRFEQMYSLLLRSGANVLAIGTGCCTICSECTYPHHPCRFPDKMIASMEAYGMLVSEVCMANQLSYYYGPNKIAYTSAFLLKKE